MKVRNVRDVALEIAATGQVVGPGEPVDVNDELGRSLCEQPGNWVAVKASSTKATASVADDTATAEGDDH